MELLRTEGLRKEYGSKDSKVVALKPTNLIINKHKPLVACVYL